MFSCFGSESILAASSNLNISPSYITGLGVLALEDSEEDISSFNQRSDSLQSLNNSFHAHWFISCFYGYPSCSRCQGSVWRWRGNWRSTRFMSISQEVLNLWIWILSLGSMKSCWMRNSFSWTQIISSFLCFYDRSMKSCLTKSRVPCIRFIFCCFYNRSGKSCLAKSSVWHKIFLSGNLWISESYMEADILRPCRSSWAPLLLES